MEKREEHKHSRFEPQGAAYDPEMERRRRISREVIIENTEEEQTSEVEVEEEQEQSVKPKSIWQHITTGTLLTSGAVQYYRYLIAIAVMCFLSIFLTFMSLNADREYRRLEKYATVLNERAVLKAEERYSLSSKSAVTERLKSYGIVLTDLSNDSRLIEK
jgi:hypothetical protein